MGNERLLNGEELITKQNIIKDLPSKGLKEFSPNDSWIEKKQIEKKLEDKFNFINTERIEKSNNLSVAEWIPYLRKAKVLKKTGKLWETIGHHQDNEDWLLPEEVLFLVENCELQLILGNVCASIEDCYALLLQEELCSLDEYRVFSYLCRAGLRVIRHSPSVTITSYEKQVNLDTILQQSKRSPPSNSSVKPDDIEIMIIDEEANISSNFPEKKTDASVIIEKQNMSNSEVIEIEDDIDHNPIIEELFDSSDDSSDIICISSPSYTSTEHSRLWYPSVKQCLLRSMEKVIDLCNDDSPYGYKELIRDKLDLIRFSKAEVLSLLPSAVNGVAVIHSPDSRLLPSNIVPKYSEYKVNLNVRSDYPVSNNFKPCYTPTSRLPFSNMLNNSQMNSELMTYNPLFRKAEEMQAMAMNMIQTAGTLMSVISSQNPNELWNLIDGGSQEIMRFHPRFRGIQQQRPYCRFPRRNYRAMKRKNPYDKRGGGRYFRRLHDFNNSHDVDLHSTEGFRSEVKMETVVLSDDDDTIIKKDSGDLSNSKRKRVDCGLLLKKVKTESDSLLILKDSNIIEKQISADVLTKSNDIENSEMIVSEKNNINEGSGDFIHCIEIDDVPKGTPAEIDENSILRIASTSEMNMGTCNFETESVLENNQHHTFEKIDNNVENKGQETSAKMQDDQNDLKMNHSHAVDKNNEVVEGSSCSRVEEGVDVTVINSYNKNELETISHTVDHLFIRGSLNCKEMIIRTGCILDDKITSWREYKNTDDSQLEVDETLKGPTESVLQFEDCINYGDVFKALQIFKEINLSKRRKKNRITFDVYLPGASFKKTLKVLPNFRVIILRSNEELPTPMDLKCLETDYQDQIPFLFTVVFNETVGFYLYNTISLPSIFE